MPTAISGNLSYTLKDLKKTEQKINYQREEFPSGVHQLYAGKPLTNNTVVDVPPQATPPSEPRQKSSNYDVVDEMYASMDDFENRLKGMSFK